MIGIKSVEYLDQVKRFIAGRALGKMGLSGYFLQQSDQ